MGEFDDLIPKNEFSDLIPVKKENPSLKQEIINLAKTTISPYRKAIKPFGEGVLEGSSFGTIKPQQPILENSVMNPLESTAYKAGKIFGGTIPIMASSTIGSGVGATLGAGEVASQALGGVLYGALKGGANQQSIPETINDMASQGILFGGFSTLGQVGNYVKKVLGKAGTGLANWFYNVNPKIAEDLLLKGKAPLGEQALNAGEGFRGFKNQTEVYNKARMEQYRLNNSVNQQLKNIEEDVLKANPNKVKINGTPLLEYNPTVYEKSTEITPPNFPPYKYSQSEPLQSESMRHMVKIPDQNPSVTYIPETTKISPQTYPGTKTSLPGGEQYDPYGGIRQTPVPGAGQFQESLNPSKKIQREVISNLEGYMNLRTPENGFAIKKDLGIDVSNINEEYTPMLKSLLRVFKKDVIGGVKSNEYKTISKLLENDTLTANEANEARSILDKIVGRDYLKEDVTFKTDSLMEIANYLRKSIAEKYPEIAQDLSKEHLMLNIERSLRPFVAGTRMPSGNSFSIPAKGLTKSPLSLFTATRFKNLSNTPNVIGNIAGKTAISGYNQGLLDMLNEERK